MKTGRWKDIPRHEGGSRLFELKIGSVFAQNRYVFSHESMSGGVWPGAHKMCAPEAPCFEAWKGGLEACFGPKQIFDKNHIFLEFGRSMV